MGRRKSIVWTGIALCGLLTATGCGDKEQITLLEDENRGLYADLEMLRSEMDSAKQQRDRCEADVLGSPSTASNPSSVPNR